MLHSVSKSPGCGGRERRELERSVRLFLFSAPTALIEFASIRPSASPTLLTTTAAKWRHDISGYHLRADPPAHAFRASPNDEARSSIYAAAPSKTRPRPSGRSVTALPTKAAEYSPADFLNLVRKLHE
jgi:hypothetical protein